MQERVPAQSQQSWRCASWAKAVNSALVSRLVGAWQSANPEALLSLLTEDAKFSMPPIPTWFGGRANVVRFFAERVFATPWRLTPLRASSQLAFAGYQGPRFSLAWRVERRDAAWRRDRKLDWVFGAVAGQVPSIFFCRSAEFSRHAHSYWHDQDLHRQLPLRRRPLRKRARSRPGHESLQLHVLPQIAVLDGGRQERSSFGCSPGATRWSITSTTPPGKPGPFLHLSFCGRCGGQASSSRCGYLPALGAEFYAVNLACLDNATDDELANAKVRYVDGLHDDWANVLSEQRHL